MAHLRRSPSLSFIPLSPSNLRPFGAPPSIGRRKCPHEPLPLEGAAECSEAGLAFFFAAKPPPLCFPHWGRGTASAVDRVLSYIVDLRRSSSPLFHTASTLSGSLRSPPSPRGEGFVSRIPLSPSNLRPFGAPPSIGRRECPREPLPLEGAAERSEAGLASFLPFLRRSRRLFAFSIGKGVVSRKPVFSFRCLPHWGRGTAQRWIGCFRLSST